MIDEVQAQAKRLARMDSPSRIKWLRDQAGVYTRDLAAREFFRLACNADGFDVMPYPEAAQLFFNLAGTHGLTSTECAMALHAEWEQGLDLAEAMGEKIRIIALSHIKMSGSATGVASALLAARNRFPSNWPWLTAADLQAIALGFQQPFRRVA